MKGKQQVIIFKFRNILFTRRKASTGYQLDKNKYYFYITENDLNLMFRYLKK